VFPLVRVLVIPPPHCKTLKPSNLKKLPLMHHRDKFYLFLRVRLKCTYPTKGIQRSTT
jgi:hypothetical protein